MRRTADRADTSGMSFEALRARFERGDVLSENTKGRIAPVVELLPLVPFIVQFSFLTDSDTLTPLWPLGIAAGMGWMLLGHWRIGLGYAFGRLVLLYAGFMALVYVSLSDMCDAADPRCIDSSSSLHAFATPLLWALCAFYAVTALTSAYLLSRSVPKQGDSAAA